MPSPSVTAAAAGIGRNSAQSHIDRGDLGSRPGPGAESAPGALSTGFVGADSSFIILSWSLNADSQIDRTYECIQDDT